MRHVRACTKIRALCKSADYGEGLLLLLLLLLVTGGVDPQEPTRLVQEAGNVLTHVC